jgi:hypothetical protein
MLTKFDSLGTLRGLEHPKCSERTVKRLVRSVAIVIGTALCFNIVSAASATNEPIKRLTSKEYAKGQLTVKNYKCLARLYGKESAWKYKAHNGSHYGIPQGRSEYLRTATPLQQIDWGLRYIGHRYGYMRTIEGMQPDTCRALDHWYKHSWH